jgi:cytochrome c oxidase assembly protein subunit 15
MYNWYVRFLYLALGMVLCVIVLGAWVRLTDAGLGCPDWPGCYGYIVLPGDEATRAEAQIAFPERALDAGKAWREMIHRYIAAALGFVIILIAGLAWANREQFGQPVVLPIVLLAVVILQGLLGMLTVTLLLKPLIVMGHLLGGLTTAAILFWLILEHRRRKQVDATPRRPAYVPAVVALVVLVGQIALGGWTSSNYAALACPDLPTCNGEWWPSRADFAEGFVMWRGLGLDYEFGILEAPARVAIHYVHRLGALVAATVIGLVAFMVWRRRNDDLRRAGILVLLALAAQISLGISVVWFGLPLGLAVMHNGVAALLLLSVLNLNHATSLAHFRSPA